MVCHEVLYLYICGAVRFYFLFWCAAEGIGSVSYVWGACWEGYLGVSTLGGGPGDAYGVSNLGDGMGGFFS